ncbi:hypothetical protein [Pseudomonas sp. S1Bt23]|uniref:hypothetical protein n=1 Tax=Pseudomonas sp. S1Bt23 TaxID=3095074 RepID=UPI002A5AC883|nr:hypothetical protein [Pseudomonas sp. S1Bt23]WPO49528.1 hypothetical protein SHB59_10855 [Pseudomonas sp. S1Bt23]
MRSPRACGSIAACGSGYKGDADGGVQKETAVSARLSSPQRITSGEKQPPVAAAAGCDKARKGFGALAFAASLRLDRSLRQRLQVRRMAGYKRKLRFLRDYRHRNAFPLAKNNLL